MSRSIWTKEEDRILVKNYASKTVSEIMGLIGRSKSSIYGRASLLGLKKEPGFAAKITAQRWKEGKHENSKKSHFKKGHTPQNKGKSQAEYMTKEQIAKSEKTRFKKGNKPHNYLPVGSTRINGDGYHDTKVADPNTWTATHRLIWVEHFGEIKEGENIQFKDGDKDNLDINNLYKVSRPEQMLENTIHRYPSEVKDLIRVQSKFNKKVKEYAEK